MFQLKNRDGVVLRNSVGGCRVLMDSGKTSWIQELNKQQLIEELTKRNISASKEDKFDVLRKRLRKAVKRELKVTKYESEESAQNSNLENVNSEVSTDSDSDSIKSNTSTMSGNNANLNFVSGRDKWETFSEQLEFYLIEKDITDEKKKVSALMTRVDQETYDLIKELLAPAKIIDKKFDDITKLLQDHFNPKPSIAMERCKFHQSKQEPDESIAEFAAKLKKLSLKCEFKNLKEALHDQLVCGIRDKDIRVKLFEDSSMDYDKALKIAITHESAVKNAIDSLNTLKSDNRKADVFAFSSGSQQFSTRGQRGGHRGGSTQHTIRRQGADGKQLPEFNQGITCYCCGRPNHTSKNCRFIGYTCNHCHKRGHLEKVCKSRNANSKSKEQVKNITESEELPDEESTATPSSQEEFFHINSEELRRTSEQAKPAIENVSVRVASKNDVFRLGDRNSLCASEQANPMFVSIVINGIPLNLEIDSGTYATIISNQIYMEYFKNFELRSTSTNLKAYTGSSLQPIGKLNNLSVEFNGKFRVLDCFVLPGSGPGLIGRKWLKAFEAWPLIVPGTQETVIQKIDSEDIAKYLSNRFSELFSNTPGLYSKSKVQIRLKDGAQPITLKFRHMPHAEKPLVEKEIDRLVDLKHLEPVEVSEWATPIVPVFKNNNTIRICGDFKLTVNPQIIIDGYPLHTIDEIFFTLQGGMYYSELDLFHAYMQFLVDESCRDMLTIVTHKGLYRYTKMPEGISPAPAHFQKKNGRMPTRYRRCNSVPR